MYSPVYSPRSMYEVCLIQNRKDEMKNKIEVLQHTLFFNFSPPSCPLAFYTFGSPLTTAGSRQ